MPPAAGNVIAENMPEWPVWAIKYASLTPAQLVLLRSSFAKLAQGTKIYRAKMKASADKFASAGAIAAVAAARHADGELPAAAAFAATLPDDAVTASTSADSQSVTTPASADAASLGSAALPIASGLAAEDDPASALYSPVAFFFDTFYDHMFTVAPYVRPLFKNDMKVQGRALVRMVDAALTLLEKPVELRAALVALAGRHVKYGAKLVHYSIVGETLLYALQTCLGPEEWTPDVALAWQTVYSMMLAVMMPAHLQAMQLATYAPAAGTLSH